MICLKNLKIFLYTTYLYKGILLQLSHKNLKNMEDMDKRFRQKLYGKGV